jgi:hypothetical protein
VIRLVARDGAQLGQLPFLVAVVGGAGELGRLPRSHDRQGNDGGDEEEDDDR